MNLHKRIYFCFSLSLFSFFLSIDRNRRLSSPKSLGCLGFCFSCIKRWRVLVWLPFQLLIVDTRERNVGKGFIHVDFVLIWRTAERIDSPQCIPSIYCRAHGVCVYTVHWVPYGGGVYLLTIAIFASLASSVITSQRALQKKRRLPRNVSPGIHVKRCVRPGGHPSYTQWKGETWETTIKKTFQIDKRASSFILKREKNRKLGDEIVQNNRTRKCKKKRGEKIYKERMMMRLMSLSWWVWCICSAGWRGRDVTTCV